MPAVSVQAVGGSDLAELLLLHWEGCTAERQKNLCDRVCGLLGFLDDQRWSRKGAGIGARKGCCTNRDLPPPHALDRQRFKDSSTKCNCLASFHISKIGQLKFNEGANGLGQHIVACINSRNGRASQSSPSRQQGSAVEQPPITPTKRQLYAKDIQQLRSPSVMDTLVNRTRQLIQRDQSFSRRQLEKLLSPTATAGGSTSEEQQREDRLFIQKAVRTTMFIYFPSSSMPPVPTPRTSSDTPTGVAG
jgi:hypothetical protein